MILAFLTSRLITRIITDRVHDLADVVGEVTAGKLEARVVLPAGPPADAFDSMGQAFNVMLARVEALIDELRAVTDGLAHGARLTAPPLSSGGTVRRRSDPGSPQST
jgi:methyl-accepting chemotaxis protein